MTRTRTTALAALALLLGLAGCGAGGSGEQDAVAKAIRTKILADTGLMPGLSFGGIVVAVGAGADRYFSGSKVVAKDVRVSNVRIKDKDKTATADIRFDISGESATCTGSALAQKKGDSWSLGAITVSSCK